MYCRSGLSPRPVEKTVRGLGARDAVPDRETDQPGQVLDAELEHDAAAIGIDARRGNPESRGDLLAGPAGDDELENLSLAPAQYVQRVASPFAQLNDPYQHVARVAVRIAAKCGAL